MVVRVSTCSSVSKVSGDVLCRLAKSAIYSRAPGPSMISGSKLASKNVWTRISAERLCRECKEYLRQNALDGCRSGRSQYLLNCEQREC